MSTIIDSIEQAQTRAVPVFQSGDRVRVHFQVVEGTRRRIQVFEGAVIKRQGSGARETFTVRKQSFGVGVERTFPLHSPKIEQLEVASRGDVRRAKLYYLRDRVGKRARIAERRWGTVEEGTMVPAADGGELGEDAHPDAHAQEASHTAGVEPQMPDDDGEIGEDGSEKETDLQAEVADEGLVESDSAAAETQSGGEPEAESGGEEAAEAAESSDKPEKD